MNPPLSGKAALVTGASRGIGAAIARRLARDGADVAISYIESSDKAANVVRDIRGLGVRGEAFQVDQADQRAVAELVLKVHATFGRLDILVNNAGVLWTGTIAGPELTVAQIEKQFAINLTSVATAVRTAVPLISDNGRIICIGTIGAVRAPCAGLGDYIATKAAIAGYARSWARDLGPRGITVNVVNPGAINTEMNSAEGRFGELLKGLTALGRFGTTDELAAAVAFLVSPDASYITGISLNVDGGQVA